MQITLQNHSFTISEEFAAIYTQFTSTQLQLLERELAELCLLDDFFGNKEYKNAWHIKPIIAQIFRCLLYEIAYFSTNIHLEIFENRGPIYQYRKNEKIGEFNSLLLCVKNYKRGDLFGFADGVVPTKGKQNFFGIQIQQMYKEKCFFTSDTTTLNNWIRETANKVSREENEIEKFYIKWYNLSSLFVGIWRTAPQVYGFPMKVEEKLSEDFVHSYNNCFAQLLTRYTVEGACILKPVHDLSLLNTPGLYILCIPREGKYYIGQTRVSLRDRIFQHFTRQNSGFDTDHGVEDVQAVYYIKTSDYIDLIEQDLIASIPNQHLCNSLAGGVGTITSINEKSKPIDYIDEILYSLI